MFFHAKTHVFLILADICDFGLKSFWSKDLLVITNFRSRKKFIVNCLYRIFVPKRLVRVNPGGRVCDPPPPVISRVKIVLGCC